jgi:hypothetical protein
VIVRIATEGQYKLEDGAQQKLNELDNEAVAAVEAGDQARFQELFGQMVELVRGGEELADDDISGSDVILPPADISFEEAQAEFTGEGLIPD